MRGLTELFTRARREGNSLMDVLRAALSDVEEPEWLSPRRRSAARATRIAARASPQLLQELQMEDLV